MRIAIVSDTHSRTATIDRTLRRIGELDVQAILHCGDLEDASVVSLFPPHTHFVFGNCDHDREEIVEEVRRLGAIHHGAWGQFEAEGMRIAWTHGDDRALLHDLEVSDAFDYLFYGHTHQPEQHRTGRTLVANPGALHRARPKQFALLDLKRGVLESIVVDEV